MRDKWEHHIQLHLSFFTFSFLVLGKVVRVAPMWLLCSWGCSGWLTWSSYVIAWWFRMVVRALLCGCSGVLEGCQGDVISRLSCMVVRVLLFGCSGVLDCCQGDVISRVFGMVVRALLFCFSGVYCCKGHFMSRLFWMVVRSLLCVRVTMWWLGC